MTRDTRYGLEKENAVEGPGKEGEEGTKDKGRALTVGSSRISSSGSWSSATASEARLCWPPLMFCKARVLLGRSRNFIKKSTRSGRILNGRKSEDNTN